MGTSHGQNDRQPRLKTLPSPLLWQAAKIHLTSVSCLQMVKVSYKQVNALFSAVTDLAQHNFVPFGGPRIKILTAKVIGTEE